MTALGDADRRIAETRAGWERMDKWLEQILAGKPEWERCWRKKRLARSRTRSLIRRGIIIAEPCFCGAIEVEVHHRDYADPLDISFLCRVHHNEGHALARSQAKGGGDVLGQAR